MSFPLSPGFIGPTIIATMDSSDHLHYIASVFPIWLCLGYPLPYTWESTVGRFTLGIVQVLPWSFNSPFDSIPTLIRPTRPLTSSPIIQLRTCRFPLDEGGSPLDRSHRWFAFCFGLESAFSLFRFLVTKDTLPVGFCTPRGGAQEGFQPSGLLYYMAHFIPTINYWVFLGIFYKR